MNELRFPLPDGVVETVPASRWTEVSKVENADVKDLVAYCQRLEADGFLPVMKNEMPGGS